MIALRTAANPGSRIVVVHLLCPSYVRSAARFPSALDRRLPNASGSLKSFLRRNSLPEVRQKAAGGVVAGVVPQVLLEKSRRLDSMRVEAVLKASTISVGPWPPRVSSSATTTFEASLKGPQSVRRPRKKRAMFSISVAKYRPHRPHRLQCGSLQSFLAGDATGGYRPLS